jgi:aspartyl aminopeptidase
MLVTPHLAPARELCGYLAASPSPYHAVAEAAVLLDDAGF